MSVFVPHRVATARRWLPSALLGLCLAAARPSLANPPTDPPEWDACFASAAQYHGVAEPLLRAIAMQESGMQVNARRANTNGTQDLGLMQINSRWLPQLQAQGVSRELLMQPCANIYVGAWVLALSLREHGDSWQALGRYHSATPHLNQQYAWAVYRRLMRQSPNRHNVSVQALR